MITTMQQNSIIYKKKSTFYGIGICSQMFLYSVSTNSHLIVLYKQYINQVVIKKLISIDPLLVCIFVVSLTISRPI